MGLHFKLLPYVCGLFGYGKMPLSSASLCLEFPEVVAQRPPPNGPSALTLKVPKRDTVEPPPR